MRAVAVAAAISALAASARAADLDWTELENESVRLLSRYLQLDTINPPGNEARGAAFFRALFEKAGIESQVFEAAPGRSNLVARIAGDGSKPSVVLMHHMDVVPADARYWQAPPFGGEIRDGYVWGRGALDAKGLGIAEAVTMLALARADAPLQGDVVFLGVADEETGGALGAGFMAERHLELFANAGVVLNEGGWIALDEAGGVRYWAVESAQKIPLWLRLTAVGAAGHGAMPRPNSAPNRLVAALARIAAYQTPLRVVPQLQRFYADTARFETGAQREKLADLSAALRDPAFAAEFTANPRQNAQVRNTISITALAGSDKTNVIPAQATAELDARLLPDQDPDAFLAELEQVIGDDSIQIERLLHFAPASSPAEHELFGVLREIAARRHPNAVVTTPLATGFTDCHYFRERGIPCYGFMPFEASERDAALVHGNDERISVANVKSGVRLYYEIVLRLVAEDAEPGPVNVLPKSASR